MEDARFEDVGFNDKPLRLRAETPDDLTVVSALMQDAVGLSGEISWMPRRRRLVIQVNRFRWEDRDDAQRMRRAFERVRTAIVFDSVQAVRTNGLNPAEKDTIYSILSIAWTPGEEPSGQIEISLAGDGALLLDVECLDLQLADLTRPWEARSGQAPGHDVEE